VDGLASSGRLYRYDTSVGGIKQYRIRLGFFPTRAEAEAAGARLASEVKLPATPWLVQPTVAEYKKYAGQALSNQWVVNISSTPTREDSEKVWRALDGVNAKSYLKKLAKVGQPGPRLYRSEITLNGQVHYRIRLGFFASQSEAESAGQGLATAAGLSSILIGQPWAVRPTVDEEKANSQ
jgi:septal ring-binding cell division protein DamX